MRPPRRIQVGAQRLTVSVDSDKVARVAAKEGASELLGNYDSRRNRILIEPHQAAGQKVDTLLHECLHAVFDQTGLAHEWGPEVEEGVVRRLTPALLDLLRRNPKLVAFLCE